MKNIEKLGVACMAAFVALIPGLSAKAAEIPFALPADLAGGTPEAVSLALGDLNGDGREDLVVGRQDSSGVLPPALLVYLSAGVDSQGRILYDEGETVTLSAGLTDLTWLSLADLDRDGDTDLVLASAGEGWITWFANAGDGSFGDPSANGQRVTESVPGVGTVLAADLDRDGRPDLVAGGDFGANWYRNTPSLTEPGGIVWLPAQNTIRDLGVAAMVASDLDRDGDLDLIMGGVSAPTLTWSENLDGLGAFATEVPVPASGARTQVAAGDVNGDGFIDLAAADCQGGSVAWYSGTADPAVAPPQETLIGDAVCVQALQLADLDRDGDLDVVVRGESSVAWYENQDGAGDLATPRSLPGGGIAAAGLSVLDLDRDGDADVTVAVNTGAVVWWENSSIHRNALLVPGQVIDQTRERSALAHGDLDRDGVVDLVEGDATTSSVSWWRGTGDGFAFPETLVDGAAGSVQQLLLADLDRNGIPDLVAVAAEPQRGVRWYAGTDGQGGFAASLPVTAEGGAGPSFEGAVAADLDGDGDLDVAAVGLRDGFSSLRWYANEDGEGNFSEARQVVDFFEARGALAAGDMDGDGDIDLVVAGGIETSGRMTWLANDGQGQFSGAADADLDGRVLSVAVADVDGDGAADLIAAGESGLHWVRNTDGGGTLGAAQALNGAAGAASSLAVVDLDLDGDADVLSASLADGRLLYHENLAGSGRFAEAVTISDVLTGTHRLAAWDVDRDGDGDLVAASNGDLVLAWYENRGGQVSFGGADLAPERAVEGGRVDMLRVRVVYHGRVGDSLAEVASLALAFEDAGGSPLTGGQLAALLETVDVYRDLNLSGTVDEDVDVLVAQVAGGQLSQGTQSILLPDSDFNVRVGAPADFIVSLSLADSALQSGVAAFRVVHRVDPGASTVTTRVEDFKTDLPLLAALSTDLSSGTTALTAATVTGTTGDEVDGSNEVISLREAVLSAAARPDDETIILGEGIYSLSIPGSGEENGQTGDLDINKSSGLLTIQGAGAGRTVIDAGGLDRVLDVHPGARVVLQDLTLTGGNSDDGGGLRIAAGASVQLARCELINNLAVRGAGLFNQGSVQLTECTVRGNSASGSGGGVANSGQMVMSRSLVADNAAESDAGLSHDGTATVEDSTIALNQAALKGGGIGSRGELTLRRVTISGNAAGEAGGLLRDETGSGSITLAGSLMAGNTPDDCQGTLISAGFNLLQDASGCTLTGDATGNQLDVDPLLGPLQDNGGPTWTLALLPGSPAVDGGSCAGENLDQRGGARPLDLPTAGNLDDGCDIGAVEAGFAEVVARINVPVRWCAVAGTPSISTQEEANAVLIQRTENASSSAFEPQGNLRVRSGATALAPDFPILEDLSRVSDAGGTFLDNPGDVFIDPLARDFDEFLDLIARCRTAWQTQDPTVVGITAVHINQFVDENGAPLPILGLGGRALPGDPVSQAVAGRVMVVDSVYRLAAIPPDRLDRLLGHELGHAMGALPHGNGLDDDRNSVLDDDDERTLDQPRFDGTNIMQYRNGTEMSILQLLQMRQHAQLTIPDLTVSTGINADEVPIDSDMLDVLDFGFLEVLDFDMLDVLDFDMLDVLDFEMEEVLDFDYLDILDFGMSFEVQPAERPGNPWDRFPRAPLNKIDGNVSIFSATAGLPWPDAVRTETGYYYYLDLDLDDVTGARPVDFVDELGNTFPGGDMSREEGVDLIARVVSGAGGDTLTLFTFKEGNNSFVLTPCDTCSPLVDRIPVGLLQDTGGEVPVREEQALGVTVAAQVEPALLLAAGWSVSGSVGMEALTVADCDEQLDGGIVVDCQCTDCSECPDFPGCQENGVPDPVNPGAVLGDVVNGVITFVEPVLPECQVSPAAVLAGETFTVAASGFPRVDGATVRLAAGGTVLADASLDAQGEAVFQAAIPPSTGAGSLSLSVTLVGEANRALCSVQVTAETFVCVRDVLPPVFRFVPEAVTVQTDDPAGTPVVLPAAEVADICDPAPVVESDEPSLYPPGVTTVTFTARDAAGNTSQATTQVTVELIGGEGPTLLLPEPDPLVVSCTTLSPEGNGCVDAGDPVLAAWLAAATATAEDGSSLEVLNDAPGLLKAGVTTITFTATDEAGRTASGTAEVQVIYDFSGFLPPLSGRRDGDVWRLRAGRTVPVKFRLACGEAGTTTAGASFTVERQEDPPAMSSVRSGSREASAVQGLNEPGGQAEAGSDGQYVLKLETSTLQPGDYLLILQVEDGMRYTLPFIIEEAGTGRGGGEASRSRRPGRR